MINKITLFVKDNQNDMILIIGVILISLISFGAGRLTRQPIEDGPELTINTVQDAARKTSTEITNENLKQEVPKIQIIGNKNSKLYHYPWCSGAKNMKEENKVFFNSIEEAKKAGYKPASNCPGL